MALALAHKLPARERSGGKSFRLRPEMQRARFLPKWSFLAVLFFLLIFLVSQTYSLLQSTQASQVKTEELKDERESSRKEFSPAQLESFLANLLGRSTNEYHYTSAASDTLEVAAQVLRLSDILLISQSSPRAPPL